MKQLREQIKKEIKKLSEELGKRKYPLPAEIRNALVNDLKLRPLIRYVNNVKAANTIPPSYRIFLHNGKDFDLYIEKISIVAKIGNKSYFLINGDEINEAIKAINILLTAPIMQKTGDEDAEGTEDDTGGDPLQQNMADTEDDDTEMEPEETTT